MAIGQPTTVMGTSTSGLSVAMATHYVKTFLEAAEEQKVYAGAATEKKLPKNVGKTMDFMAYREQARITAALTEGTVPTEAAMTAYNIQTTIEEWGAWVPFSTLYRDTSRDPDLTEASADLGRQLGRQLDWLISIWAATNCGVPLRVDNSSTLQATGTASGGSTTTVEGAPNQGSYDYSGGRVAIYGKQSTNTGYARPISSHATTVFTINGDYTIGTRTSGAFANAIDTTDVFRAASPSGLAATDVMTANAIRLALIHLKHQGTPTFPGGFYKAFPSINVEHDIRRDSEFLTLNQERYRDFSDVVKGEIGRWYNIQFITSSNPYRQSTSDISYSASGAVHITPFVGMNALATVDMKGMGGQMYFKRGNEAGTHQPIPMYDTLGWKAIMAVVALNALFSVNVLSGSSLSLADAWG